MRYLAEDMDGDLYEYVEGLDGWGNPIGYWQGISQPEDPSLSGLGELYEAPDGTVYQVQGLEEEGEAEAAEPEESGETEAPRRMGPRQRLRPRARVRRMPPGRRPQRPGPGVRHRRPRKKGGFLKKLLPIAKFATRFIPGVGPVVSSGIDVASKLLKRKGVAGYDGLGALYAAPDGTVYQVQGPAEEDLNGLYEDEELRGFEEDEELQGFAEDEELRGLDEEEELRGFAEDQDMQGIDGYVRQDSMNGLEAYVPQAPPRTPWHVTPAEPPEIWKTLW